MSNTTVTEKDSTATEAQASQSRWRSKTAWVAVFAILGFVLGNWGLFDKIGLTNESWQQLVELVLASLAAFGVFNNPTSKETF